MKKVLLVHNYYQQRAGEYGAVTRQIALLREYGHEVVVYSKDNKVINEFSLSQKIQFFPNTIFSKSVYNEILQLIEREQPDVAHVHNVYPLMSPALYQALKEAQVPIIQTLHNFRFLCANSYFYVNGSVCQRCKNGNTLHAIRHRCYRDSHALSALYAFTIALHRRLGTFSHIDRFITLNDFTRKIIIESGLTNANNVTVLGNFLAEPLSEPGSPTTRQPFLLFLGRILVEKGLDTLIEAMTELPHLGLKILGTGEDKLQLEQRTKELGLENRVEFLGWVEGEKKWHLLREAMATIIPSVSYEQFPTVALESLSVATPVISSDLAGISDLVQHEKTGLLFKAGDSASLAKQLCNLAESPRLAREMGQNGRQHVLSHYVGSVHYEKLIEIYDQVANRS